LNPSTWIAIYLPLFILFFIIIPQTREMEKALISKLKRRKGVIKMTNELIKTFIGKNCKISTGQFGTTVVGEITNINENWLEVETKKGKELINVDFVQSIKIK